MSDEKRKVLDCRTYPSEKDCTLSIEGREEEVLEAATQHAVTAHGIRTVRNCASSFEHL